MRALFFVRFFICSLLGFSSLASYAEGNDTYYVTYEFSGGRFGDNLLSYLHAKWIAYNHNIALLYKPFPYSEQLALHDNELPYVEDGRLWKKKMHLCDAENGKRLKGPLLYSIGYFSEFAHELETEHQFRKHYFSVDWKNEGFQKVLKECVKPKYHHQPLDLPKDRLTVALHMRKGGGHDPEHVVLGTPLKIPPDQFYCDALKTLYHLFNQQPLFVHLFTDDPDPAKYMHELGKQFKRCDIVFSCRTTSNTHNSNVLEDFFAMMQFDCLIRPESNYSYVASKLHQYKAVVCPQNAILKNGRPFVNVLGIKLPDSEYKINLD